MMSDRCGFDGSEIMFSSNDTPAEEFILAKQLGATINLDDITHIEFLKECAGIPEKISCRYNPGGVFALGTDIMDNPGDAKYGMTTEQIFEAFKQLKELGVKEFRESILSLQVTQLQMNTIQHLQNSYLN